MEQIWDCKMEPWSPSYQHLGAEEQYNLDDYNDLDLCNVLLYETDLVTHTPPSEPEPEEERKLFAGLPLVDKEEDQWLGEKLKMPNQMADYFIPATVSEVGPFSLKAASEASVNIGDQLMEYSYDHAELTHLTPPQTPPQQMQCLQLYPAGFEQTSVSLQSQQQQQQQQFMTNLFQQQYQPGMTTTEYYIVDNFANASNDQQQQQHLLQQFQEQEQNQLTIPNLSELNQKDYTKQQLEEVNKIAHILQLSVESDGINDDDSSLFSLPGSYFPNSPCTSESASSNSDSSYAPEQDEEWSPGTAGGNQQRSAAKRKPSLSVGTAGGVTKKRATRPYGRGPEEKKSRKKEQNKNAATRYRQKKKKEIVEIRGEESELTTQNKELEAKVLNLNRDLNLMKQLIREMLANGKFQ